MWDWVSEWKCTECLGHIITSAANGDSPLFPLLWFLQVCRVASSPRRLKLSAGFPRYYGLNAKCSTMRQWFKHLVPNWPWHCLGRLCNLAGRGGLLGNWPFRTCHELCPWDIRLHIKFCHREAATAFVPSPPEWTVTSYTMSQNKALLCAATTAMRKVKTEKNITKKMSLLW